MGNILISIGVIFIVVGILLKYGLLSWFGNLYGDISYRGENFSFFMPITSMLILSLILSVVLWLIDRFR